MDYIEESKHNETGKLTDPRRMDPDASFLPCNPLSSVDLVVLLPSTTPVGSDGSVTGRLIDYLHSIQTRAPTPTAVAHSFFLLSKRTPK